jgi:type I restriction enzyme S subunit
LEFKNNDISRDFIYWLMRTKDYQGFIVGSASGTSIMHTSPTRICEYEFKLPPLPEQKAIAEVLSSLDDKIDLLHRQNQTLEQMAETLFRKWFVEDANESWEERPLSGIATFLNGLACQKFPPKNEIDKLPVLKIRELKDGFTANSDWATTEIDKKYLVANGDIIFSWSASLLVKIWDGGDCVLNQHLFKVTSEEFPKWFYYLWSKYHLDQFIAIAKAHATTMGHIKRGDLDDAMVFVPSNIEIEEMNKTFEPIIEKIIANNNQLNVLVSLRETLLPKLMSGEIRVEQDA